MKTNQHKETELSENVKIVIVKADGKFVQADAESAVEAIDYAAKQHLRIPHSLKVEAEATILGNVLILDTKIPLSRSHSSDVKRHEADFNGAVVKYLSEGVRHVSRQTVYGALGNLASIGYVTPNPVRTITIETSADEKTLSKALGKVGALIVG